MPEQFDPYHKWLGIRPEEQPASHYRLLGITQFEDDQDTIANAADQRMAHIRSFQTGNHAVLSQKLLNEISAAKICLLNSAKKQSYDEHLRNASMPSIPISPPIPKAKPLEVVGYEPIEPPKTTAEAFDFGTGNLGTRPKFHKTRKTKNSNPPTVFFGIAAIAALLLAGLAVLVMTGGNRGKEPVEDVASKGSEATDAAPTPSSSTSAKGTVSKTSPEPGPSSAGANKGNPKAEVYTKPISGTQATEVGPPKTTESSPEVKNATLTQASEQFEKDIASAASADDFRGIAVRGFALANRAIAEKNEAVANTIAKEALVAARKSGDADLIKQATLFLIQLHSRTPGS